jgi:hypothetical protein
MAEGEEGDISVEAAYRFCYLHAIIVLRRLRKRQRYDGAVLPPPDDAF